MKFSKYITSFFGTISNYKDFAEGVRPAKCLRIEPVLEAFYSRENSREKLQIIYANIRV
jgi:hypothetical protein